MLNPQAVIISVQKNHLKETYLTAMEMGINSLIDTSSSNAFQFWVLRLHPYNNINVIAEKTPQKALQVTKQMYQFW